MKLHLPLSLLALALSAPLALGEVTDPGNIVFIGDSITQGGNWSGAGARPSYRYSFFKNMVDNGLTYSPMGIGTGSSTAFAQVTTDAYRGQTFDNTHEAAASARTYTWSGIPQDNTGYNNNPGTRSVEAPVWNMLGLTNPQTGSSTTYYNGGSLKTYTGQTYAEKYGENAMPDTVCLMIGINDLIAVKNGTVIHRADGTSSAYTHEDIIANTQAIVQAYQQYNPNVKIVVMGLLPTAPNNVTYGMSAAYNEKLKAAVTSWGTASSSVTYADVSCGIGITSHYDNNGAHPNAQGELIVAGNLANALGVGQRTLGLGGKASAEFSHRLDTASAATQTHFSVQGDGSKLSTYTDADTGSKVLLMQAGGADTVSLSAEGWDVSSANGYTLTASIQLYNVGGNSLQMQFGDGTVGNGLLNIATDGIYWGDSNTLLYSMTEQGMNDFRVTYMASGNTSDVAAGYYVWMNNQLIGEALSGSSTMTDAFTLGSSTGSLGYAAIADLAWESGNYVGANTETIAASMSTLSGLSAGSALPVTPSAVTYNSNATTLNGADAWGDGSAAPTSESVLRFDSSTTKSEVSLSGKLTVKGLQFETAQSVSIASDNAVAVGSEGIVVSDFGSSVFIKTLQVTEDQEWSVGVGKYLRVGTGSNNQGSLAVDGEGTKTITVTGGGGVVLDTKKGSLQATNWEVSGGSTLYALWHTVGTENAGGLGSGSVTLDNGTLAANYGTQGGGAASQGNWFWGNDIIVGQGGGTITQAATSGNDRYVLLSGSISNTKTRSAEVPVLKFTRENTGLSCNDATGYILAGDNSAFTGKILVDSNTYVRVGAESATGTGAGTLGTLHAGDLENNGTLTLTHTDAWTVASNISGTGVLQVGATSGNLNTATQVVTLSGDNSGFTGAVKVNSGTLKLGSATALGAETATLNIASGGTVDLNGQAMTSKIAGALVSGAKITNSSDTATTWTITGTGFAAANNLYTGAVIDTQAGKTINLTTSGNHVAFAGKLAGSGVIEKSGAAKHLFLRSNGNEFNGTLQVKQGYLILDSTSGVNFADGYRPDVVLESGATLAAGSAYQGDGNVLKLGNVSGSGNFASDYGNQTGGIFNIDVEIDAQGGVVFDGMFQKHATNEARNYNVTKRGAETWTLGGANTATGTLTTAEGKLVITGSWAGAAAVEDGAKLELQGEGKVANSGMTVMAAAGGTASLGNVSVGTDAIAAKADGTQGSISNAMISATGDLALDGVKLVGTSVTTVGALSLTSTSVNLKNSDLTSGTQGTVSASTVKGSGTLSNLVISGSNLIAGNSPGLMTLTQSEVNGGSLSFYVGSEAKDALTTTTVLSLADNPLTTSGYSIGSGVTLTGNITLKLYSNNDDLSFETAYHHIFREGDKLQLFTVEEGTELATVLENAQFSLDDTFRLALGGGLVWDMSELATTGYLTVVPEPATATLSLLALAALCARRRRK